MGVTKILAIESQIRNLRPTHVLQSYPLIETLDESTSVERRPCSSDRRASKIWSIFNEERWMHNPFEPHKPEYLVRWGGGHQDQV